MAKITVKLSEPLVIGGLRTRALELRDRVTIGDLIAAEKAGGGKLEQDLALVARLAGLLPEDLEQLSEEDYLLVLEALGTAKKARLAASSSLPTS